MARNISMDLVGEEIIIAKLKKIARELPNEIGKALFKEAQIERTESMRRTPVDLGTLKGSHEVSKPVQSGKDISVQIKVGGPAAPYAIVVHEDLEAFHKVGQSKFLESTIRESAPHMARRIAKRINLR